MYQSVEDDKETPEREAGWTRSVAWIGLGLLGLMAVAFLLLPDRRSGTVELLTPEPEARRAYLRALGETDPALRRARLTDFLNQYPQNPRANAAQGQLIILDAAADRDWMAVLTVAQDPTREMEERRTAVLDYRDAWGRYLGARDGEIDALLEDIAATAEPEDTPDRDLPDAPDAYPGIPDDRLAGGPSNVRPPVTYRPSPPPSRSRAEDGVIVSPRVVRNVTPRYPRRALRRGVEAVVVLSLNIDADGRVAMAELISVDADRYAEDFVKAAERAALRTRYRPQTVGGRPVPVRGVQKRYRFESDQ